MATNFSMNAYPLYPRGGGLAKWLLQWGQDTQPDPLTKERCTGNCTRMNFLQVPFRMDMSISKSGSFDYTYFQPMQHFKPSLDAGWRWGVSPNALDFAAGTSYKKSFLYQLGTAGSSILPNIVSLKVANSIADAYLQPASVWTTEGGVRVLAGAFDPADGCYHIDAPNSRSQLTLDVQSAQLARPVFCVEGLDSGDHMLVSVGGERMTPLELVTGREGRRLVAQLLRTLPRGQHQLGFAVAKV